MPTYRGDRPLVVGAFQPSFRVSILLESFDFIVENKDRLSPATVTPVEAIREVAAGIGLASETLTIDTVSHLLNFPVHNLQSAMRVSNWNRFMLSKDGARRFLVCYWIVIILTVLANYFVDQQVLVLLWLTFLSWLVCIGFSIMVAIHWIDIQLFKLTIRQFDCIYVIVYAIIFQFTEVYRWVFTSSPYYVFSMVVVTTCSAGYAGCVILLLVTDSVPKQLASRQFQLFVYFTLMLIHAYFWVIRAYTQTEHLDENMQLCLYACIPVLQLNAEAAFTLAVFWAKFVLSLILWPTHAVILRNRVVLKS
jgi:hypothetical protein